MNTARIVAETFKAKETLEGAGVLLRRGFSRAETAHFDPFLLFDDFSSGIPEHYLAGFPWHPHRGMETVTYLLDGAVRHKDSLGNEGVIGSGAVQWMTAGSGIIHEEMPEGSQGVRGFQLWVNLPKKNKMTAPQYQDASATIVPEVSFAPGAHARIVAGTFAGAQGAISFIAGNPLYMDVMLEPNSEAVISVSSGYTVFAYVIEGVLGVGTDDVSYASGTIILFEREGDSVVVRAPAAGARFLLISGALLAEPIAWHGPIVMNTQEELREAFTQLREGTFIRSS